MTERSLTYFVGPLTDPAGVDVVTVREKRRWRHPDDLIDVPDFDVPDFDPSDSQRCRCGRHFIHTAASQRGVLWRGPADEAPEFHTPTGCTQGGRWPGVEGCRCGKYLLPPGKAEVTEPSDSNTPIHHTWGKCG